MSYDNYEHGPAERLTAPGSRVGFAERDASRPAFGGSSLVSLTREPRHTHFAKAGGRPRTDRTVTGRRPQAYYADEPRPKAGYELTHCA